MTQFILWYCLTAESQKILRRFLAADWRPPGEFIRRTINLDRGNIEDTEEISHLMRDKPKSKREVSW